MKKALWTTNGKVSIPYGVEEMYLQNV